MSILEWIILVVIILLCVAGCVFVARLKKQGYHVPGRMCAGCPDVNTMDKNKNKTEKQESSR